MGREIKRVALDFDWPLNEVWKGFLNPERFREDECNHCEQTGYSPRGLELKNRWYGYVPFDPSETGSEAFTPETPEVRAFAERNVGNAPEFYGSEEWHIQREAQRLATLFNKSWSHHLTQEDVDALVEAGRLYDFTHTWDKVNRWQPIEPKPVVTARDVNLWSIRGGFGHDAINASIVWQAQCEREGVPYTCAYCKGHGSTEKYPGQREESEKWWDEDDHEPPTGEGWQVWETVSEGSPISPVFPDREGLIGWLMSPAYNWGTSKPLTREQAENFTKSAWAPTLIVSAETGVVNGDQFISSKDGE